MFTIGLAFLVAKYGATAYGDKAAAARVGAIAGAVLDFSILEMILRRLAIDPLW
ncbi:MAG: hypothetical protein DDT26_02611 [Dehalococcoidia bacterium]|nr:hypothetical protein [Chloroflexota bacterium]